MWYKIDMTKLVVQLLPPILRSKFLTALMKVLITPFAFIYDNLLAELKNRLKISIFLWRKSCASR